MSGAGGKQASYWKTKFRPQENDAAFLINEI